MFKLDKPYTPLRIGIDVDGVLADFNSPYREHLIKLHGYDPFPLWNPDLDPSTFHWTDHYNYKRDIVEKFWQWLQTPEAAHMFWGTLDPLFDDDEAALIDRLMQEHDVYFITKRPLHLKALTEHWLERHICGGFSRRLPTTLVSNHKGHIAAGLQLHAMIDDKPANLKDVLTACGTGCVPLMFDQPWNRRDEHHQYIRRIETIEDGLAYLEQVIECQRS